MSKAVSLISLSFSFNKIFWTVFEPRIWHYFKIFLSLIVQTFLNTLYVSSLIVKDSEAFGIGKNQGTENYQNIIQFIVTFISHPC